MKFNLLLSEDINDYVSHRFHKIGCENGLLQTRSAVFLKAPLDGTDL